MALSTLWINLLGALALFGVAALSGYLAQVDLMRRRRDMLGMANVCASRNLT